jgi:zinc protease
MHLELLSLVDPLAGRTGVFADYAQHDRNGPWFDGDVARADHTTLDELRALAKTTLRPDKQVTLILRPDPATSTVGADVVDASFDAHSSARWKQHIDPAAADRPQPYEARASLIEQAERYRLPNGLQVILLRSFFTPTLHMQMVFRAGFLDAPPDRAGLAQAAVELLASPEETGFSTYADAGAVLDGALFHSGVASAGTSTSFELMGFSSLQDFAIQGLGARFRSGNYPSKDTHETLARWRERLSTEKATRERRLRQALFAEIYGNDHPYVTHTSMTSESAARISVPALDAFRRDYLVPNRATLILTGRVDLPIARAHVQDAFGAWRKKAVAETPTRAAWPGLPIRTAPVYLGVPRPRVGGSSRMIDVAIAYPTEVSIDEHYATRLIAGEMLAMRVSAVRERLGAAYTVTAQYVAGDGPGLFLLYGTVDGARGSMAVAAMRTAVSSAAEPADFAVDFVLARRRVVERLLASRLDRSALAGQLGFLSRHDLPLDFYTDLTARVAAATQADVRRTLVRDLLPTREVMVVTGDAAAVQASYVGAGITGVRTVED